MVVAAETGDMVAAAGTGALVADWIEWRILTGTLSARSAQSVRARLAGFCDMYGHLPPGRIDRRLLARWQATIGRYSPATRAHQVSAVKGFFAWLIDNDMIGVDPTVALARVRQPLAVPRALLADQAAAVVAAAGDPRDRAVVALMLQMGLRCVEVVRLDLDDWDRRRRLLTVVGKGGHEAAVPVPCLAADHLEDWVAVRGDHPGPLIVGRSPRSPKDGRMTAQYLSVLVGRIMAEAGVHREPGDRRTAHALRHTAASDVLDRSGDLRAVQAMLRHRHLASTEVYLRRADLGRLREAMEGRDYRG